ncbi:hypothetical protein AKI39_03880 [Bordetella sp. H567]|uniref:DUF748 domain-containing protein n=1 Tax=Bordetella sp. H567 TaxID=1697043 RepID=UPI00081D290A|nr:DUF748 domain-containing protein [Bordetella sp. H567]AOB30010.1 hypothetical protein AKI39_03880 [Bordetella sp. H567]
MPSYLPRIRFTRRFLRITGAIVGFILLLLALAAWQVPEITRRALTRDVAAMLGRDVQVGKITFNPFSLTLRVHDLAVAQPGGARPLLTVAEADASASWKSLFWFAPVVDALVLREPRLALVRDAQAHFNFSDVQQKLAQLDAGKPEPPPQEKDKPLPRFSLNNMRLENGSITLDDKVTGRTQVIDEIALGVPFISDFGYATDIDVVPKFHARINGSPFDLNGTARPFDVTPTSTLDVVFSGLELEKWADAWGVPLPVKLNRALLDSDLHIAFEQPRDAAPKLRITGGLSLRELDLREASDESLAAWQALNVRGVDALPLERQLRIGEVELVEPNIQTRRYADQRINWLDAIDKLQRLGAGARTEGPTPVSTVKTASAPPVAAPASGTPALPGSASSVPPASASPGSPASPSSAPPASAPPASPASPPSAPPASAPPAPPASVPPAPPESASSAPAASGAPASPGAAPAAAPVSPTSATAAAAEPDPWRVNVGKVSIVNGKLRLRDAPNQLDYALDKLSVSVTNVQLPQPKDQPIAIELGAQNPDGAALHATGGVILQPLAVNLDARAERLPLAPFASAVRRAAPITLLGGTVGAAAKVDIKDHNGTYAIQASDIKLDLAGVSARDESLNPPVTVGVKTLALGVDRFVLGSGSSKFDLRAAGILGEGKLSSQGSLTLQPLAVKASVDLSDLNVATLAPYAASRLNATVRSIRLGAKGDVDFTGAQGRAPMKVTWKGGVDVNDLNLQDRVNRADFLAWKLLSLRNMAISLAGGKPTIDLGDVTLDNFYGNVLLNSQGRLNVLDLVAEPGRAGGSITQDTETRESAPARPPASSSGAPSSKSAAPARDGEMPDIAVRSVTLKNGRATFNDRFVRPNYTAELSAIEGSVSAVSSTDPKPAKVSVNGRVYRTAPLAISGIVQPFAKFLTLDIKASARGVDLPRFTTYSSKYVGYPIERGKLSMDVEYRIKDRQLQASNRVRLDQLTFGPKSNSPQATTLPVMLAVALLKDRSGNIDINLPISGSLDDPNFSVGGIILRVIGNLIVKAVTSPFSLLASAFGGGDELSYITFAPGSTALTDDGKEKLKKLAAALADRPSLKMDIAGRADPVSDEAGLRQAWVDTRIRIARSRATGKSGRLDGDAPLSDAERAKYLEAAYDNTQIDNKPRNFIGMAKSLPPDQMEALLKQAAPAGEEQLRKLADARAQAAYEQLQQDGAPMDRVFMVAPTLSAEGIKDDGPPNRVEFSLKR